MSNFTNIPTGLKITAQIPLNVKEYVQDEATLADLGVSNNLAFTYHDGIKIYCFEEKTTYEWRQVRMGEEGTGLVPDDFTYPDNLVVYGYDYSNKTYNFFRVDYALITDVKDVVCNDGSVDITETSTEIILSVDGHETILQNGDNITITGSGTNGDPYIINSELTNIQVGDNIIITGSGTAIDPYIISADHNTGWLTGDTKEVVCDNTYLTNNFDGTGLGTNERIGWAIMNGNNGTPNDTGLVIVAYGTTFPTLESSGGEKEHLLIESELPKHFHKLFSNTGSASLVDLTTQPNRTVHHWGGVGGGANENYIMAADNVGIDATIGNSGTAGDNVAHNNMQPYRVRLRIMKL